MIVKLIKQEPAYHELTTKQHYVVIGIEADEYRLLNDHGKPYLYPPNDFEIVDPHESFDWVSEIGSDGERYAYPIQLNRVGFFEDFFNSADHAIKTFWQVVNRQLAVTAAA